MNCEKYLGERLQLLKKALFQSHALEVTILLYIVTVRPKPTLFQSSLGTVHTEMF